MQQNRFRGRAAFLASVKSACGSDDIAIMGAWLIDQAMRTQFHSPSEQGCLFRRPVSTGARSFMNLSDIGFLVRVWCGVDTRGNHEVVIQDAMTPHDHLKPDWMVLSGDDLIRALGMLRAAERLKDSEFAPLVGPRFLAANQKIIAAHAQSWQGRGQEIPWKDSAGVAPVEGCCPADDAGSEGHEHPKM